MSTPRTAVATLPHYHHAHGHHSHTHTHSHHPPPSATSNYRSTAANSLLYAPTSSVPTSSSATARFLPLERPGSHNAHAGYASTDGITQTHQPQSPPSPPPHGHYIQRNHAKPSTPTTPRHRVDHNYSSTMAASMATATATVAATDTAAAESAVDDLDDLASRKRRRSREPDWNNFYRNGLPKEVIVIDDTPEPEANTSRKLVPSTTNGHVPKAAAAYDTTTTRQPVKRRRRDAAPGYHVQYVGSNTNTPLQHETPIGSTHSSDRTSFVNTTAPTSLSSNSQYEEAPAPLKRKRTTRQQVANAKRRDVDGLGGQILTYKPPPFPPKKVSDVNVRVVHDVSITLCIFRFPLFFSLGPSCCAS